ncbi:MAG: ABC transporter substrate-binding protein [Arenicella sp.]
MKKYTFTYSIHVFLVAMAYSLAFSNVHANSNVLKVGLESIATSLDPHFLNIAPNNQVNASIFQGLTSMDGDSKVVPMLAESWRLVDDTVWEFKLRKGVKFHDMSDFDAFDITFTMCRIAKNSDSFNSFIKQIEAIEVVDKHTILINTLTPFALLPIDLASVGIISSGSYKKAYNKDACDSLGNGWPDPADFDLPKGQHAVGTGPYKVALFNKAKEIILDKHDAYWGSSRDWEKIELKRIDGGTPMTVALLNGEVDIIENLPIENIGSVMREGEFNVYSKVTSRLIYLAFDYSDSVHPTIENSGGRNPFKSHLVRQAISLVINRNAIVERLLNNFGIPANQIMHVNFFGHDDSLPEFKYSLTEARRLMKEAGYENGFDVTFYATNDRYINDEKIALSISHMLKKIGIRAKLETMGKGAFFKKHNQKEFAIWMAGWGTPTGEISNPLRALITTKNDSKGFGYWNPGEYSNSEVDKLVADAMQGFDEKKREELLKKAQSLAIKDLALIPLHYQVRTWAMRKDILYRGRSDEYTIVSNIKRLKSAHQ